MSTLQADRPLILGGRGTPWRRFSIRVARRLVRSIVHWGGATFYTRELTGELPDLPDPGFEVREVDASHLGWLIGGANPNHDAAQFRERFRKGGRCFVAVDDTGQAAHVRWVTSARIHIPEIGLDVVPRAGEAYFFDGYTRADARGRGVDGQVRCVIFQQLKSEGLSRIWSYVRSDNPIGQKAAAKWQMRGGTVRYLTLFGVGPFAGRHGGATLPDLQPPAPQGDDADARGRAWREWFEGWLQEPLTKRSTGTDTLPAEYFASAAAFIVSTLNLDRSADRVLDVGCDSAMISRRVAPSCQRFVGVDFIPGMLSDARRLQAPLNMAAADGRQLPFASHAFDKVYCSAVIHTLPSARDGEALIDELIRVCRPGGEVLVASVPDVRKRRASQRLIWRRASLSQRLSMIGAWMLPSSVRQWIKKAAGRPSIDPLRFLEYDLSAIARRLAVRGVIAEVVDFPETYWSVDFRTSRSNLHITVPRPTGRSAV